MIGGRHAVGAQARRGAGRRALAGFLLLAFTLVTLRGFLLLPERCGRPSLAEVDAGVSEAVAWFDRNQLGTGRFVYERDVRSGEASPGYNLVRHAGVLVSLYQAAAAGWDEALEVGDRGLAVALRSLVRHDDWAAFAGGESNVRTGATALLVAALTFRRDATGDRAHDDLLTDLGRFLVAMQGDDGRVHARWDSRRRAPVPGEFSPFFTGEAFWALTRLHAAFPEEGWDRAALRTAHYVTHTRDDVEEWFPPISDHWVAYALAELATGPPGARVALHDLLDGEGVDWIRRQGGLFGVQVRIESQRTGRGWLRVVRGGTARGGGVGTLGEGLAGLRVVAATEPRLSELRDPIDDRLLCVAGLLVDRQVDRDAALETASPDVARGAWLVGGATRMDDQQHALSALLLVRETLSDGRSDRGEEARG